MTQNNVLTVIKKLQKINQKIAAQRLIREGITAQQQKELHILSEKWRAKVARNLKRDRKLREEFYIALNLIDKKYHDNFTDILEDPSTVEKIRAAAMKRR